MNDEQWECIFKTNGITNAHIVAGRLEAEGIPTQLKYDVAGTIYAVTIDGLGEVKILVPAVYRKSAEAVLSRSYEEKDLEWEKND
ncbi:MAG: DUF2007 domain-containing protein [Deltaproteobacteria bacterium]|nr:DUF2007 domain-containing protein [Deltaproteobacteria bacterium]